LSYQSVAAIIEAGTDGMLCRLHLFAESSPSKIMSLPIKPSVNVSTEKALKSLSLTDVNHQKITGDFSANNTNSVALSICILSMVIVLLCVKE
jgi:hypothetical protein